MAFDAFLKIDGIPGDSTDAAHKGWIEILSFKHGIEQPVTRSASAGGARAGERANHEPFVITKDLDIATCLLERAVCNGQPIKSIELQLCRATGSKQQYMSYKLTDSIVTFVRPKGECTGDGALPIEEVGFSYSKIDWTYTDTDDKTGAAKGNVNSHWDVTTNTGG